MKIKQDNIETMIGKDKNNWVEEIPHISALGRFNRIARFTLLMLLGLLLFAQSANAQQIYYVSPSGTGNADGSSASHAASLATLMSASSILRNIPTVNNVKGVTVRFLPGTYSVTSYINFGSSSSNITGATVTFEPSVDGGLVEFVGASNLFTGIDENASSSNPFNVTIKNVTIRNFSGSTRLIYIGGNYSNWTFENCIISNISKSNILFDVTGTQSSVTFTGCKFLNNTITGSNNFINTTSRPLVITDCEFTGNTTAYRYLYNSTGGISITNTTFTNNTSTGGTYFIYGSGSSSSIAIKGSNFTGNRYNGRLIHSSGSSSNIQISDCIFDGNYAGSTDYFIHSEGGLSVKDSDIKNQNSTAYSSYLLYNSGGSSVTVSGTTFDNNRTTIGMIFNSSTLTSVIDSKFTGNTMSGAAIFSDGTTNPMSIENCTFENNTNTSGTAFLYSPGSNAANYISINNSTFKNNTSSSSAFLNTAGALRIKQSQFEKNTFSTNFLNADREFNISESRFTENEAPTVASPTTLFNGSTGYKFSIVGDTIESNILGGANSTLLFSQSTINSEIRNNIIRNNNLNLRTGTNIDADKSIIRYNTTASSKMYISGNTISGNTISGANATIIYALENSYPVIYENSLFNNTISGTTSSTIRNNNSGGAIYNNTISSNTGIYSFTSYGAGTVLNNTIYNSGDFYITGFTSGRTVIRNNLVVGAKINPTITFADGICSYNISNGRYFEGTIPIGGGTSSDGEPADVTGYFDTNLTYYNPAKPPIHDILNLGAADHPILGKGNSSQFRTTYLVTDQRGELRSEIPQIPVSVGSVDYINQMHIETVFTIYAYKSNEPLDPIYTNFANSIVIPSGTSLDELAITLDTQPNVGSMTIMPGYGYVFEFIPKETSPGSGIIDPSVIGHVDQVGFTATITNGTLGTITATGTLIIKIVDYTGFEVPGYIDDSQEICFGTMGTINFTSADRYNTSQTIGTESTRANRFVGFSIPLVGDLNNDGKPEIVALSDGAQEAREISILDGLTGKRLSRKALPVTLDMGWHPSPAPFALVNTGEDPNRGQIIIAYGPTDGTSSQGYRGKLVSYRIKGDSDPSDPFGLDIYWTSDEPYSISGISGYTLRNKPVPQILDFDGTGPCVLVYNRIFDAHTGKLKMTLETLSTAHTGRNPYNGSSSSGEDADGNINFSFTHDMDGDGKYDVVAGGQIYYDLNFAAAVGSTTTGVKDSHYKLCEINGVTDGRTGVADINGDGIPDVVVVTRLSSSQVRIVVWNPDFQYVASDGSIQKRNAGDNTPYIMADITVNIANGGYGNNSYVYIGDIDGRKDHISGKHLPEIAILSGVLTNNSALKIHPNIEDDFPEKSRASFPVSGSGVIFGMTWDDDPSVTQTSDKLKLSFILEHDDRSRNTGFTMYDFDNDGMQEICYRDEQYLRIIKAATPYVYNTDTEDNRPDVILFRRVVASYTGFEYPVIADIDGDNSAEMIVMGLPSHSSTYWSYIYAVGTNGDKFAPALPIWNQFMYSPFKINSDLSVPAGPPKIDPVTLIQKRVRLKADNTEEIISYKPFNGTLIQATKHMETERYNEVVQEPIVFFPDGYLIDGKIESGALKFKVGNASTVKTALSTNTPIQIYKTSILDSEEIISTTLYDLGVTAALQPGTESDELSVTLSDAYGVYYVRLGDDSKDQQTPYAEWSYGTNDENGGDPAYGTGQARRYLRDCRWANNQIVVSKFVVRDDALTIQEFADTGWADILGNDVFPDDTPTFTLDNTYIVSQPIAGKIEFNGLADANGRVKYTHTGAAELPDGIDQFTYRFTYTDPVDGDVTRDATVYIYILQNNPNGFAACMDEENVSLTLKQLPEASGTPQVQFYWYNESHTEITGNPQPTYIISKVQTDMTFYVRPEITGGAYMGIDFPEGKINFYAIPANTDMVWTGAINTNWNNPDNWVNENGSPTLFIPKACVNVTIPTNDPVSGSTPVTKYPSLVNTALAHDVTIENRAMIANTHYLTYNNADFEVKFGAAERDRWVMYSAPFGRTYSGDFMLKAADNYPIEGAVYASIFQEANPDGNESAVKHKFTKTFSNVEKELTLGTGILLYVDSNKDTDAPFSFPSSVDRYQYYYDNQWGRNMPVPAYSGILNRQATLPVGTRYAHNRFITEMAPAPAANGTFTLTVPNDMADSKVIMVTNPFNAYLKVDKFLAENDVFLENAYIVWDGSETAGFIEFLKDRTIDDTYITSNGQASTGDLINPHQSFFVVKKSTTSPTLLVFKPEEMTLTTTSAPYPLKSAIVSTEPSRSLQIKATFNDVASSSTAVMKSNVSGQAPKVTYSDGNDPIDIYTIANGEAVSINAVSEFPKEIQIGVRLKEGGKTVLEFGGLESIHTYGYEVYLKDGSKVTNLRNLAGGYEVVIDKSEDDQGTYFEVNNRFSLVFAKAY